MLQEWIEEITGVALDGETLADSLKDGVVLCRYVLLHLRRLSDFDAVTLLACTQIGQQAQSWERTQNQ